MNEPNLTSQSNLTPQQAAAIWPGYRGDRRPTGVKIVGPADHLGHDGGYTDPVVWMDAFYRGVPGRERRTQPQIDYLAFHWYDYGCQGSSTG